MIIRKKLNNFHFKYIFKFFINITKIYPNLVYDWETKIVMATIGNDLQLYIQYIIL